MMDETDLIDVIYNLTVKAWELNNVHMYMTRAATNDYFHN